MDLEGAREEVNVWTEPQVTATVKNCFSVAHLRDKLLDTLVEKGLDIKEIMIHDGNADSIVADEESSTQSSNEANADAGGEGNNKNGLIVAAICGGVVCLVITIALLASIRRRRRRSKFGSARGSLSTSDTDTLNLRSSNDDLPDGNTTADSSQHDVLFPDVFGNGARAKVKNKKVASERWCSEPGASESDISLGQLLGDYDNDELNCIEDEASSYQAIQRSKKKNRKQRQPDEEEVERAKAWAKQIRNKKSSAPQPRENNEHTI